ncbi:hypothetical protein [Microtetraspora glauca]|uniref:Uncharacterized protein n=1 Tax=Microtetraspora glauca TaxID=1996 RepID=A0ABV3GJB0_MICGL
MSKLTELLAHWSVDEDFSDRSDFLAINSENFAEGSKVLASISDETDLDVLALWEAMRLLNAAAWVRSIAEQIEESAAAACRFHYKVSWGKIAELSGRPRSTVSSSGGKIVKAVSNLGFRNLDDDPRGPWRATDLTSSVDNPSFRYSVVAPSGHQIAPPVGRAWRFSRKRLEELNADGRIYWGPYGDSIPRLKDYLSERPAE